MRKLAVTLSLFAALAVSFAWASQIKPSDIAGTPNVFCKVDKEPDPILMGHWGCNHKKYDLKSGQTSMEPVEYWLVKFGDRYGLYFHRVKSGTGKTYSGWRKWYIKGSEINSGAEVKIFAKDGSVYYQWKGDNPTKMTRIE